MTDNISTVLQACATKIFFQAYATYPKQALVQTTVEVPIPLYKAPGRHYSESVEYWSCKNELLF